MATLDKCISELVHWLYETSLFALLFWQEFSVTKVVVIVRQKLKLFSFGVFTAAEIVLCLLSVVQMAWFLVVGGTKENKTSLSVVNVFGRRVSLGESVFMLTLSSVCSLLCLSQNCFTLLLPGGCSKKQVYTRVNWITLQQV